MTESEIIFDELKKIIDSKRTKIIKYINESMTQEERNLHGDNLLNNLLNEGDIAKVKIILLSKIEEK